MTVNTDLSRVQYNGNGVTTAFAFGNRVTDAAQLAVTRTVIATGVDTPLILNDLGADGYSVAGVPGSSVTVNTIAAPATGTRLTLYYNMPLTQTADYVPNDPFPAETHEGALDKLTIINQQQKDAIGRSLKFPASASTTLTPLLPSVPVDGAALVWDGVSGQMVNGPLVGDISDAAANAAIATAGAATATTQAAIATAAANTATTQAAIATSAVGFSFNYLTAVTATDPGAGNLKFNNATLASATALYISETSAAAQALAALIATWDDSTSTIRGTLRMYKTADPTTYALFNITGTITDNGTWDTITVAYVSGNGAFANTDPVALQYLRSGDLGTTGATGASLGGLKNRVINGDFRVWDYATSYALTTSHANGSANRWSMLMATTAAGIANQDTSVSGQGLGFRYGMKVGRNNGSALTTQISLYQAIETANSIPLAGKTVTLSFYAKKGANFSGASSLLNVALVSGTGSDQAASLVTTGGWTGNASPINTTALLTTSWQRFQATVTLSAAVTQLAPLFYYSGVGTAGADDNFYITGVQLEEAAAATLFEDRGQGFEELLCARYLCKGTIYWEGYQVASAPIGGHHTAFPVKMRTTPTMTYGTLNNLANATSPVTRSVRNDGFNRYVLAGVTGSIVADQPYTADAEL